MDIKYNYAAAVEILDDIVEAKGDKLALSFATALRAAGPDKAKDVADAFANQYAADMGTCCRAAVELLTGEKLARKDQGAAFREQIGAPVSGQSTAEQRADFLAAIGMLNAANKVREAAGLVVSASLPEGCPSAEAYAEHCRNVGITPGRKISAARLIEGGYNG